MIEASTSPFGKRSASKADSRRHGKWSWTSKTGIHGMNLNKDFEELLHHLNSARAKYLVVGAYAVISYTEPRYTKDIDIWIQPEMANAKKVYESLRRFGAPLRGLTLQDLLNPLMVYQIGVEPNRIDILMGIGRIDFDHAWKNRQVRLYGKEKVNILGLQDLIKAKKEAGRPHDLTDLKILKMKASTEKKK